MQKTYLSISKWMMLDEDGRGENDADEKYIPISIIQRACDNIPIFATGGRRLAD
jgi:hypothetical protein